MQICRFRTEDAAYKIAVVPKFVTDDQPPSNSPQAAINNTFAAMAIQTWYMLPLVLLVSVGAQTFDQGPQTFFERSLSQSEEGPAKEFVLFLNPSQAKALEIGGAFVRSQVGLENEPRRNEPQVVEEQNESKYENESSEQNQGEDSELEEIFKILNQQKAIEDLNEEQEKERTTEKPREVSNRFSNIPNLQQNQQEIKNYLAPSAAKKLNPAKTNSYVRFLRPLEDSQYLKIQPLRTQLLSSYYLPKGDEATEKQDEKRSEESSESENDARIVSLLQNREIAARIIQHRDRLLKKELELHNKLRELKDTPKYNKQKYAVEIENLRSNLEKQNALSKVEALSKAGPILIREEISEKKRRPVEVLKRVNEPVSNQNRARISEQNEVNIPQRYIVSSKFLRPILGPVDRRENTEAENISEEEKRLSDTTIKNIYVRINKPYLVERILPVAIKREIPVEALNHELEKPTVVRHLWEH